MSALVEANTHFALESLTEKGCSGRLYRARLFAVTPLAGLPGFLRSSPIPMWLRIEELEFPRFAEAALVAMPCFLLYSIRLVRTTSMATMRRTPDAVKVRVSHF